MNILILSLLILPVAAFPKSVNSSAYFYWQRRQTECGLVYKMLKMQVNLIKKQEKTKIPYS